MSQPYPQLQIYPLSGLFFSWAFAVNRPSSWPGSLTSGTEGVVLTEEMLVYWEDLVNPNVNMLGQLLGYSERIYPVSGPGGSIASRLSRILPFQHPTYTQLWCTRVSGVAGIQDQGQDFINVTPLVGNVKAAPTSQFKLAKLTLQFTRPHYAILPDSDPSIAPDGYGYYQEWNRYTDRLWTPTTQMLSSERQQFIFAEGAPKGQVAGGSFGKRVQRQKLKRTWYEVPEAGVYDSDGYPSNLIDNQYTFFVSNAVAGSSNPGPAGGNQVRITLNSLQNFSGVIPGLCDYSRLTIQDVVGTTEANGYWAVNNISGNSFDLVGSKFVNAYVSGGVVTTEQIGGLLNNQEFFGQDTGVLMYENVEITPRDLQIPPALMGLVSESVQLQYNVTIHVERFNPTLGSPDKQGNFPQTQGHQTAPWAGDYQFYALMTDYGAFVDSNNNLVGGGFYPFGYGYFPSLWQIL